MTIERRTLLKSGAAGALLGGPFAGFAAMPAHAGNSPKRSPRAAALVPVKDKRDGQVRLFLPKGFQYRSFHDTEQPVVLDDGTALPGRHDGMGAFRGDQNTVVLVRNHEVNNPVGAFGPGEPYDAAAGGGTTTVRTTKHGEVLEAFTSLNGTMMNCSGGVMPWGSWITCEETVNGPDVGPDFTGAPNTSLEKPHGYIFEVPAGGQSNREPITKAGRFAHEAVSFDPVGGALYLTEDNFGFASGFFRYTPATNPMVSGHLDNDGTLEMLAVKGQPNAHLEGHQEQGATYEVDWVTIDEPDVLFPYTPGETAPTSNNEAIVFVGKQGREKGAALFSRLEGQVYEDGVVYFTSTEGGGAPEAGDANPGGFGNGYGQVWGYDTRNQTLTCVYQSPGQETLDFPDNVTASPRGTLVLCEDSSGDNYLRGLSTDGQLWDIALNRLGYGTEATRYGDEFAGSTFSTDGHTLFVNIQSSKGMTFAIWGPWASIGV
ncbi:MAG TPA: alkaline phosphatase PhoX [Nocardioidaceae bacterium]